METRGDINDFHGVLNRLLLSRESESFECKEARNNFSTEDLAKHSVAIANSGGGWILLGVTDDVPRRVTGTSAIPEPERTAHAVYEKTGIHLGIHELEVDRCRVLLFKVSKSEPGKLHTYKGRYLKRVGDACHDMTADEIAQAVAVQGTDFSATVCGGLCLGDLDPEALGSFSMLWAKKAKNPALAQLSREQMLRDLELSVADKLTYAALILFGTRAAVRRFLPQSECIFEHRTTEAAGPASFRVNYHAGFFSWYRQLEDQLDVRIPVRHIRNGLFVQDIPAFSQEIIREALLNAVCHRDYLRQDSVILRMYPRRLEVLSPGGLPYGVTVENIMHETVPRNRRIAEIFEKCGFVERGGQGIDKMISVCVREAKPLPDYTRTSPSRVVVEFHGDIDEDLLRVIDRIGQEELEGFSPYDFLAINCVYRDLPMPLDCAVSAKRLVERGVFEETSRGRSTRLTLSRRVYRALGREGTYTRKRGVDDETNTSLLVQHLRQKGDEGAPIRELEHVLPHLSRTQIRTLLSRLRSDGHIALEGEKRAARWVFCATHGNT